MKKIVIIVIIVVMIIISVKSLNNGLIITNKDKTRIESTINIVD